MRKTVLDLGSTSFLILGCKKSDDSSTSSTTASTTSTTCSSVVGKVGDNSSNLVTTTLAKSANLTKGLTVFGINILATSEVADAKLLHAANITVKEHTLYQRDSSMLENSKMDFRMVKELKLILMEISMKGNSRMGNIMVREHGL